MNHKSEVLVKNHKHDDLLIKDSSKSFDRQSDPLDYDNKLMLIEKKENIKMIGLKDKENEDLLSDSKESDDYFLECESDYEYTNESDNQFFNNIHRSHLCKDSEILDEKTSNLNAAKKLNVKNSMKSSSYRCSPSYFNALGHSGQFGSVPKSYVAPDPKLFSHASREGGYSPGFQGQFIDPELVQNRTIPSKSFLSRNKRKSPQEMRNVISQDHNENSPSDSMYEDASDIQSEVNSELESRIIEFHEAKKSLSTSENGEVNEDPTKQDSMNNMIYEPEDEIDELFDRVINCEYDPDFTFLPVALDPYVKISNKLIAKRSKRYGRQMLNSKATKKSPGGSSAASSASSCSADCGQIPTDHKDVDSKLKIKPIDSRSSHSQSVPDESLAAENGLIFDESQGKQKYKPVDNERDRFKAKEIDEYRQVLRLDTSFEPRIKFHDVQEYDSTDSEVEKQKEFARVLFEATKEQDREQYGDSDEEDLSPNIKNLKLSKKSSEEKAKTEKKPKKSKHKSDTESEDDKLSKTDKKSDKKSSKSSKHISEVDSEKDNGRVDKSEPEKGGKTDKSEVVEKSEKGDKNEKHKDKKPEKIKKVAWKSTDYDMIFSTLGECFSSGHIGHDTNPIVLNRKGFYTLFFRNSKYPYDSNIDFYLFRIGFKYSLVNEPKNQPIIIDDVVDYGNFKIKLSGNISLSPNVTKMILIYSNSDRKLLEFTLTPSAFDSKPKVAYKLFYSGPLLSVPFPLKFKRSLRVLSLDNSENLGTSVIGSLYLLEKKLSELKKKKINLADYFDYICGTGSGALIALCLLKGYSMKDLRVKWNQIVSSLFKWAHSLPSGIIFDYYYIEEFKKSFINILGTDFMCSKSYPHCMVTCSNVRSNPYGMFLFRNYGNSKFGSLDGTSYAPLWLVGWSSCALPTYVRGPSNSHLTNIGYNMINKVHMVDGSVVSSSPSLVSLQELTNIYNINLRTLVKDNMDLFLSIGTSKSENDSGSINSSTWQILLNSKNLMYNTQLQHMHLTSLFEEYENKYHRIQLPIYPGCKHGKTSKEDVDAVLTSTIQYISRHDNNRIEQIVKILNQ